METLDLSEICGAFILTTDSRLDGMLSDGEKAIYTHTFNTEINMDLNVDFINAESIFKQLRKDQKYLTHMTQTGRFWFDRQYEADVIMTDLQINHKTGEAIATYNSIDIKDKTDYGKLARFLRWILRR